MGLEARLYLVIQTHCRHNDFQLAYQVISSMHKTRINIHSAIAIIETYKLEQKEKISYKR